MFYFVVFLSSTHRQWAKKFVFDRGSKVNIITLHGDGYTEREGRKEMFYLTTHSTHFIYGYMASDIC